MTHSFASGTDSTTYPVPSNRLSGITLATGGTRGFTYDASGNVTAEARAGGAYAYTYDAAGRMREFRAGGVLQAQYRYDAMGRQAVRTLVPSGLTIHSVFDSEGRRIAEYNQATGALIREYVWNGWDPVAVIEGGVIYLIRADHIGRPAFATTLSGTKVWSATYLPFGGVHVSVGAPIDARFPGQWFQAETGLHQNWMRDYDPTTGRYLQADPLGLVDGASVYGYALQNPGRWVDPRGLQAGPGLSDQFNPFGLRDSDTNRDYTDYFNQRFPKSVTGARQILKQRIGEKICLNRLLPTLPGITGKDDVDISPDMNRFGDEAQGWWERNVRIGNFEFRTDDVDIRWEDCTNCYSFSTKMYVSENAGQDYLLGLTRERRMRYAEWPLSGSGCCDF